jgi:hypothetical protein
MARGMWAVAAGMIVGGIVVAAFESAPPAQRFKPIDATPEETSGYAVVEPGSVMTPAASTPQAGVAAEQETEPALKSNNRDMENHS